VVVDEGRIDPGLRCDSSDRGGSEALLGEQRPGGVEDLVRGDAGSGAASYPSHRNHLQDGIGRPVDSKLTTVLIKHMTNSAVVCRGLVVARRGTDVLHGLDFCIEPEA